MEDIEKGRAYWEDQLNKIIAGQEEFARSLAKDRGLSYVEHSDYFNAQVLGLITEYKAWINENFPVEAPQL